MKKIFAILFLLAVMANLSAQEIVHSSSVTLEWDPVTTLYPDKAPLPVGEVITYRVYMAIDDEMPDVLIEETIDTFSIVTFPSEGLYNVGVRAVRLLGGTEAVSTWAIIVIEFKQMPSEPGSLRIQ